MQKFSNHKNNEISLTFISAIVVQICNIITTLIIPRSLILYYGSDLNGVVSAANNLSIYLALVESSITAATVYKYVDLKKRGETEELRNLCYTIGKFYKKTSYIVAALAILIAGVYSLSSNSNTPRSIIFMIFMMTESIYVVSYYSFYKYNYILFSEGRQYFIAFGSAIVIILSSIIKYILIINKINILIVLSISIILDIIRLILIRVKVSKEYQYLFSQQSKYDDSLISQKWDSFVLSVADSIKSMVPIVCISVIFNTALVSVYSIYITVMHVGNSILTMFTNGILPVVGGSLTEKNNESEMIFRTIAIAVISAASVLCVCLCGMMMSFINIYIGKTSDISYQYPLLSFLLIVNTWMTMVRQPLDMTVKAFGRIKELRVFCLTEIAIAIVISFVVALTKKFEYIPIGILVASIYRLTITLSFCSKKIEIDKNNPIRRDVILWCVFMLILAIVSYLLLPKDISIGGFLICSAGELIIVTGAATVVFYKNYRVLIDFIKKRRKRDN